MFGSNALVRELSKRTETLERQNEILIQALKQIRNQNQDEILDADAGIRCMNIARKALNKINYED